MTTDLVVFLPGIMGSTLRRGDEDIWAPSPRGALAALSSLGARVKELQLSSDVGDQDPHDGVVPGVVMPDLHVVPGIWTAQIGYSKILRQLRRRLSLTPWNDNDPVVGNFLTVPYDWRLSNRYNGRRLANIVEPALDKWRSASRNPDARLIFICHSMGGLVARWYIQREGGAELTRKLITLGTPHRGALTALEQLVNGVRVGPRPFRLDLTDFARSLPSLHQLMPEYACITGPGAAKEYRKTTEVELPELSTSMAADAMLFHTQLNESAGDHSSAQLDYHPIVGQKQRTRTTATLSGRVLTSHPTIGDLDERGDGTVPTFAAIPNGMPRTSPAIRYVTERHGTLPHNKPVFDELEGVLTASKVEYRASASVDIDVAVTEVVELGEPIVVDAEFRDGDAQPLLARLLSQNGDEIFSQRLRAGEGRQVVSIATPGPGAFVLVIEGFGEVARPLVSPVAVPVVVWSE